MLSLLGPELALLYHKHVERNRANMGQKRGKRGNGERSKGVKGETGNG